MRQAIDCIAAAFREDPIVPPRHVHSLGGAPHERLLLSMPAFGRDGAFAIKLVTVFPDNAAAGLPSIQGVVVLFSATGAPVAVLDGATVTRLRTAAASALASKYLSRTDSKALLVMGTGALAPYLAQAHCLVREIRSILVWGRHPDRIAATVESIRGLVEPDIVVQPTSAALESAASADIISCSTASEHPILEGKWLRAGTFVDLVGSFSPQRREADDDVMARSRIFVDTLEGALAEAGDVLQPLARGVIQRASIEADLASLARGQHPGRADSREIIVFKSVGSALEDLAMAQWIVEEQRLREDKRSSSL